MNARAALAATFAVTLFSGHVFDRTTGQPLPHVNVSIGKVRATTDASGHFALRGVKVGVQTLTLESDDVPTATYTVHVAARATSEDFRACSTTLDYNCSAVPVIPQSGGGAG